MTEVAPESVEPFGPYEVSYDTPATFTFRQHGWSVMVGGVEATIDFDEEGNVTEQSLFRVFREQRVHVMAALNDYLSAIWFRYAIAMQTVEEVGQTLRVLSKWICEINQCRPFFPSPPSDANRSEHRRVYQQWLFFNDY